MKKMLVTGGCGFIGSNFINYVLENYDDISIVNIDSMTYAADKHNIKYSNSFRYFHVDCDIRDYEHLRQGFLFYDFDYVVHFAAESHVDNSISGPRIFIETNIVGTFNLLECIREFWKNDSEKKFIHVSTDEVYGSLGETGKFTETTPYEPSSPYSASKASADHLSYAYFKTYGLPICITNCSNNYGPNQHEEKLIPKTIKRLINLQEVPIYGNGLNVRDWLYVEDHCSAIMRVLECGMEGQKYNIGGNEEHTNLEIIDTIGSFLFPDKSCYESLLKHVEDRAGHDLRYAIDNSKNQLILDWKPKYTFKEGIEKTVDHYLEKWGKK